MYLRDITVHAHHDLVDEFKGGFVQKFYRETGCVVDHFVSLINRKIKTPDTAKVALTFARTGGEPQQLINVVTWTRHFDFRAYQSALTSDRKRLVLNALASALNELAMDREWPDEPLVEARQAMLDCNFVFNGMSKDSWLSPDNKYRLRIYFDYDLDGVELFAVLFPNRSKVELTRVHLAKALAYPGCLHDYLKNGQWKSRTRFQLAASTFRKERWTADFAEMLGSP